MAFLQNFVLVVGCLLGVLAAAGLMLLAALVIVYALECRRAPIDHECAAFRAELDDYDRSAS